MLSRMPRGNVDNDGWFDDTSDRPVSAVLVFDDDSIERVVNAWVVVTDPGYAPQTLHVVSLGRYLRLMGSQTTVVPRV